MLAHQHAHGGSHVVAAGLAVATGCVLRRRGIRRLLREGILDRPNRRLGSGLRLSTGARRLGGLGLRALHRCGHRSRLLHGGTLQLSRWHCSLWRSFRGSARGVDGTDRLPHRYHRAFGSDQLRHHAVGRRGDFGIHLVSDHLGDGFVLRDCIAGLLEPAGDGSFGNALAELRHRDGQGHFARFLVGVQYAASSRSFASTLLGVTR